MSAKPEQAQAPPMVADTGPTPQQSHPMQHQTHPPNQYHQGQVMYQQSYGHVQHYQQQGPPVWNQPPQATVHYVQYAAPPPQQQQQHQQQQQQEAFHDPKNHGYEHYGTVHYTQPMNNGEMMMRTFVAPTAYVTQQAIPAQQFYAQTPQQNQGQFIPTYATTFNVANDPTYHPNHPMNRPGARQEDYQSGNDSEVAGYMQFVPFIPPMGAQESQAHVSASYTANWVSSTSSIPPEMKDEPESDNISQYDSQRPPSQLNGDWTDHEDHMSPSTTQQSFSMPPPPRPMPYVEKDKSTSQSTTKTSKSARGERNEEKRELTFDERLEKARMQKTRAENKGANGESSGNLCAPYHASATSPVSGHTSRPFGQRRDYQRNDIGFHNNNNQRGRGGYYKEVYNHNGGGEQYQPQHQPQYYQYPQNNAVQERDRFSKRDNNYSANRYENNTHNSSYNQKNYQDGNRPSNYRGRGNGPRGGYRGGYQGGRSDPPAQIHNPFRDPPNPEAIRMIAQEVENFRIGSTPSRMAPGVPMVPIQMDRPYPPFEQDAKFQNTWLDASNYPMSLAAVQAIDTRPGRGGFYPTPMYRGRGRGGFGNRGGGYRGGYSSPRYMGRTNEPTESVEKTKSSEQQGTSVTESAPKPTEVEEAKVEEKVEKEVETTKEVEDKKTSDGPKKDENGENTENKNQEEVIRKTSEVIPEVVISEPTEAANKDNEVVIKKIDEKTDEKADEKLKEENNGKDVEIVKNDE